ncbi:hypothetical protein J4730_14165, partial [Klebsiella pneumoniae]|nr:hypothetical protein [Klebsiella pneumoniae]
IVLSGFATTDLSVKFCDACQGAEPMENGRCAAFSSPSCLLYVVMCALRPLAAAERQERSD